MKDLKSLQILFLSVLSILLLGQTQPSVPTTISYQGRITDASFTNVPDGEYEFTFLIFDAASGGNLLWSETQPGVTVTEGRYRVDLGAVEPIEFSALNGRNAYLEVRIFGETLGPRSRLVSVPFALKAEGEVPEGAIILGEQTGDTAITNLGYTQQGDTIGSYYLYKKDAYNPSQPRVPQRIAWQGRLLPADGGTVGSTAEFTFTIYDSDTAGSSLWTETQNNVSLDDGFFSVELGAVNPIYPTHLSDKDLWLAVSVNGEALLPREKLSGAAYALEVESPMPEGGIVLSGTSANSDLAAKKFTATGTSLGGYYLFRKDVFSAADPSVPLLINYQGRLTDSAGMPLASNTVDLSFSIYDSLSGSTLLWSETVSGVVMSNAIYNVLLGAGSTITPETFTGPDAYLEVKVIEGATVETLSPRQRLTSVPFALQAVGTMSESAIVLGDTVDSQTLLSSGFQMTGDTLSGYYVYAKTDVDVTPPDITFLEPVEGMTLSTSLNLNIAFSDDVSGIDPSTLIVYHNTVDITSGLSVSETGATGSVTASEGGNSFNAWISDNAGNSGLDQSLVMVELGLAPTISIPSPADGVTLQTNTPSFLVEYSDSGWGVDLSTLAISLDGGDVTSSFQVSFSSAQWDIAADEAISDGPHTLVAQVTDLAGNTSTQATSNFQVASTVTNPTITSLTPNFTIGGDTVTITGTNFSDTVGETKVYFSGTRGGITAQIYQASATTLKAYVPGGAVTGELWVENDEGGNPARSNKQAFTLGLPYAYITNRGSNQVTVIDYRDNSIVTSILMPGSGPQPYGADVTPDGRWLFVANRGTHTATVVDTLDNSIVNTVNLRCTNPQPSNPLAVSISPDGNMAFVAGNNKVISVIELRKVVPNTLSGDTLCQAVTNYSYTQGTSGYQDIDFTPDGQKAVVATNSTANNGDVLKFMSGRYLRLGTYNTDFMTAPDVHNQTMGNANRNPQGIGTLPQRLASTPANPWRVFAINMGSSSDNDEDSILLNLPGFTHFDVIDTNHAGHPVCYGAKDVAVSPLGERAFMGFYYSNNIGMLESTTVPGSNEIESATAARSGCPPTCSGPGIREVAFTPYLEKVLGTIWWIDTVDSKVMVLDASTSAIPVGTTGTISSSAYTFVQATSIEGPEGIGVYPLFDRDEDGISDLIESRNEGINTVNFHPTVTDNDPSAANGQPNAGTLSGGVFLSEDGIGYYHFYGGDNRFADNWSTLKLIKIIEEVGREWNQKHPDGPRIGIGDMSLRTGGAFPPHLSHQNGLDADLRYVRDDGQESRFGFTNPTAPHPGYSQALTQELMELFCETGEINTIFYDNRANISIPGCNLDDEPGHHNHFHVRINP